MLKNAENAKEEKLYKN